MDEQRLYELLFLDVKAYFHETGDHDHREFRQWLSDNNFRHKNREEKMDILTAFLLKHL